MIIPIQKAKITIISESSHQLFQSFPECLFSHTLLPSSHVLFHPHHLLPFLKTLNYMMSSPSPLSIVALSATSPVSLLLRDLCGNLTELIPFVESIILFHQSPQPIHVISSGLSAQSPLTQCHAHTATLKMSSVESGMMGLYTHIVSIQMDGVFSCCQCKDLTRVSGQVPITLKVSDLKGESPVVRRVLVQGGFPMRERREDRGSRALGKTNDGR